MSSRLSVKPSKKERPRSSDKLKGKKRDGTPEKSTTPNLSQDALPEEDRAASRNVIINDEILALAIKEEDLTKLREPKPPTGKKTPVSSRVVVKKLKPQSEWDKPTPRMVTVLKPAPPDAPLKPVSLSGAAGPRFDATGNVIPHSILGTLEDYRTEGIKAGDLTERDLIVPGGLNVQERPSSAKYAKKKKVHPKYQSTEQSNALVNWHKKMIDRKKQQGYISTLLQKAPEQLVMNQADNYRKTQETRYLIDRSIPAMDYGKGYRIGSEFWKQQERIGDDITGMHMTLTQTERGYPAPVDHIDVPQSIKEEKGSFWQRPKTPIHYPWHKSPYLQDRTKQLAPVINDLDPHKPELTNLEIIGTSNPYPKTPSKQQIEEDGPTIISDGGMTASMDEEELNLDPLRNHPDVIPAPIFGPSLQFAQQAARWTGDSHSFEGRVGLEARVSFECYSGQRCTSFLEIKNDGTTSIYFDWKRLPKTNPFDIVNARVQRFYFDTSNGVILPGDTMKFPFVFKSPNSGVFTEQWQFETKPVVCGGAALMVTLRGVALQEDKFYEQRRELEKELARKQAEQIIQQILHDITDGIKTPDRALSPIDAYITDEEIFQRENTEMHYNHEAVNVLRELYKEFFPEEEREFREWDLSVQNFKEMVMGMDEDDERKEEFLQRMNLAMITLSFPAFNATQQKMYSVGYQLLSEAVDDMVQQSVMLRSVMGLPDKEEDELPTDPTDSKRGRPPDGKKAQDKKKDIGKPPKGKEAGAPKKSSSPTKQLKGGIRGVGDSLNRTGTPTSLAPTPIPGADPTVDKKYKDKLYIQMYKLLQDSLDKMDFMFKDIQTVENFDELENLMKTLG